MRPDRFGEQRKIVAFRRNPTTPHPYVNFNQYPKKNGLTFSFCREQVNVGEVIDRNHYARGLRCSGQCRESGTMCDLVSHQNVLETTASKNLSLRGCGARNADAAPCLDLTPQQLRALVGLEVGSELCVRFPKVGRGALEVSLTRLHIDK